MTAHNPKTFDFFDLAAADDSFNFGGDTTKALEAWITEIASRTPASHATFASMFGHHDADRFAFDFNDNTALTPLPGATATTVVVGQGHAPEPVTVEHAVTPVMWNTPNDRYVPGAVNVAVPPEHVVDPKAPLGQPVCPVNPENHHGGTTVVIDDSTMRPHPSSVGQTVTFDVGGMGADPNSPLMGHHGSADKGWTPVTTPTSPVNPDQGRAPLTTTGTADVDFHGHRPGDPIPGTPVGHLGTTPNDGPSPVTATPVVGILGTTPNDGPPHVTGVEPMTPAHPQDRPVETAGWDDTDMRPAPVDLSHNPNVEPMNPPSPEDRPVEKAGWDDSDMRPMGDTFHFVKDDHHIALPDDYDGLITRPDLYFNGTHEGPNFAPGGESNLHHDVVVADLSHIVHADLFGM